MTEEGQVGLFTCISKLTFWGLDNFRIYLAPTPRRKNKREIFNNSLILCHLSHAGSQGAGGGTVVRQSKH